MKKMITQLGDRILGVLSGFDRILLARDLTKAGIAFRKLDNCVNWVDDMDAAQRLLDAQLEVSWTTLLNDLVRLKYHRVKYILSRK